MANLIFLKRFLVSITLFLSISAFCGDTIVDDAISLLEQSSINIEQLKRLQTLIANGKLKLELANAEPDSKRRKKSKQSRRPTGIRQITEIGSSGQHAYLSPNSGSKFKKRLSSSDSSTEDDSRDNVVYTWTAVDQHYDQYVQPSDRVDLSWLSASDADINKALLQVEKSIRRWVKENPLLYYRTIYVGFINNVTRRMYGHRAGVKKIADYGDLIANRKLRLVSNVASNGFDVRCSKMVFGVPKENLKTVEVLVGYLFGASDKGNTFLGDGAAYALVSAYLGSKERTDALAAAELADVIERLEDGVFRTTLNIIDENFGRTICDFCSSLSQEQTTQDEGSGILGKLSQGLSDLTNGIWNNS